jgi:hypothetical protein
MKTDSKEKFIHAKVGKHTIFQELVLSLPLPHFNDAKQTVFISLLISKFLGLFYPHFASKEHNSCCFFLDGRGE